MEISRKKQSSTLSLILKTVQVTKLRCCKPEPNFLKLFLVLLKAIHNTLCGLASYEIFP